jgi:hypothetical protein
MEGEMGDVDVDVDVDVDQGMRSGRSSLQQGTSTPHPTLSPIFPTLWHACVAS